MTTELTPNELQRHFPNASLATRKRNRGVSAANRDPVPVPKLEPIAKPPLAHSSPVQVGSPSQTIVILKGLRKRLLDEDNTAEKFMVDSLRYAGLIPSDAPAALHIEYTQEKTKGPETLTIDIIYPES